MAGAGHMHHLSRQSDMHCIMAKHAYLFCVFLNCGMSPCYKLSQAQLCKKHFIRKELFYW